MALPLERPVTTCESSDIRKKDAFERASLTLLWPSLLSFKVITQASNELRNSRFGSDAVSFMFAQVGNDQKAKAFLGTLDSSPQVGGLVDVCSNYENESEEMKRTTGIDLSPELWLTKVRSSLSLSSIRLFGADSSVVSRW
jgi:hypothetical protein